MRAEEKTARKKYKISLIIMIMNWNIKMKKKIVIWTLENGHGFLNFIINTWKEATTGKVTSKQTKNE